MALISYKIILVLFSLSIVISLAATNFSTRKSVFKKRPMSEFFMELGQLENDEEEDLMMVEDLMGDNPDIGAGMVEGEGGCKKMPDEHTTASGGGQLSVFTWVIFLLISLFNFILNC